MKTLTLVTCLLCAGCATAPSEAPESGAPAGMFAVTPLPAQAAAPAAELHVARGRFFAYALPEGWRLGEDGQFALSMGAPDGKAFTAMVGNAGLPPGYPPDRFVYEKLMALQPQGLRIGQARKATPASGFQQAWAFDVEYSARGVANRGVAKVHVANSYDAAVLAMTAAISEAKQWPGYASWLPMVAEQISALDGRAFGARGIMAQNIENSKSYAAAAKEYRDSSQRIQQQVTDARNASQDKNNAAFRENLGAVQTYVNPYDTRVPVELPTKYSYYWVSPQGEYLGTDDPGANPNSGGTGEWKQLPKKQP
jgi:hypothetical protein